jgi:hypothetical protein
MAGGGPSGRPFRRGQESNWPSEFIRTEGIITHAEEGDLNTA